MTISEDPLVRLGALVNAARMAVRDEKTNRPLGIAGLHRSTGISRQVITNVETGKPLPTSTAKSPRSAAAGIYTVIEEFFKWPPGSIVRYLDEPDAPEPKRVETRSEDVPARDVPDLGDEKEVRRVGRVVAQWYRSAPLARRDHAWDLLMEFIESHPMGGAGD